MADNLIKQLSSPNFVAENFVKQVIEKGDGVADLLEIRQKIQTLTEDTSLALKKNVYKNYTQFIETAKEISYLESELYQLSHMLTEQKALMNAMLDISLTGNKGDGQKKKDSLVSKEEDHKATLSSLLEKIEGCSIGVVDVPGRFIVHSGDLVELDPVSFVQTNRVHAFLLNDSLMIATILPKRRSPMRYKFQAIYELDNLPIVNVKDMQVKNAFKILMYPDPRLYQCDSQKAKREWLDILEETKKAKMTEIQKKDILEQNTQEPENSSNPFDDDKFDQLLSLEADVEHPAWLLELPDDLDVCIAQREFESAVALIEQANEHFKDCPATPAIKEIRMRIDHRVKQLIDALINELSVRPDKALQGGPRAVRRAVSILIRLGKSTEACNLFLKNRSAIIKHNLRQLKIEGASVLYIKRLCTVFFSNLIETGREFTKVFDVKSYCCSTFVVWAQSELRLFVGNFSRQVFSSKTSLATIGECVSVARKSCIKLLEIGLDLTFVLNAALYPDLVRTITDSCKKLLEAIKIRALEDKWRPMNHVNVSTLNKFIDEMKDIGITNINQYVYGECWVFLTNNTAQFSKTFLVFVDDVLRLYSQELHAVIVDSLVDLFTMQLEHIKTSLKSDRFKSEHNFIIKNTSFLFDTLLHQAEKRYEEKVGYQCKALMTFRNNQLEITEVESADDQMLEEDSAEIV